MGVAKGLVSVELFRLGLNALSGLESHARLSGGRVLRLAHANKKRTRGRVARVNGEVKDA